MGVPASTDLEHDAAGKARPQAVDVEAVDAAQQRGLVVLLDRGQRVLCQCRVEVSALGNGGLAHRGCERRGAPGRVGFHVGLHVGDPLVVLAAKVAQLPCLGLRLSHPDRVHALAGFELVHIGHELGPGQQPRVAGSFGQRGVQGTALVVHAGGLVVDDPLVLISFQEGLDDVGLAPQHLPALAVQALGHVAVLENRVPLVALAPAAPVALLQLAGHPGRVQVVHRTQVGLHVHARAQRGGQADHHAHGALVHRIGHGLARVLAHAAVDHGDLLARDALLDELVGDVAHEVELRAAGLVLDASNVGLHAHAEVGIAALQEDRLRGQRMLLVVAHDVDHGAVDLVFGGVVGLQVDQPHVQSDVGGSGFQQHRAGWVARRHHVAPVLLRGVLEQVGQLADLGVLYRLRVAHRCGVGNGALVRPPDRVLAARGQQLVALGVGQRRVRCDLAAGRGPGLELGHVVGKHDVHVLPGNAPQLCHVDEGRQRGHRLVLAAGGDFHVGGRVSERRKPGVPVLDPVALHLVVHHVAHLVVDLSQRVGDGRAGEGEDATAVALALDVVGQEAQRDRAVRRGGVEPFHLHLGHEGRLLELVRLVHDHHVDAEILERDGTLARRADHHVGNLLLDLVARLDQFLGSGAADLLHRFRVVHHGRREGHVVLVGGIERFLLKRSDVLCHERVERLLLERKAVDQRVRHDHRIPVVVGDLAHRQVDLVGRQVVDVKHLRARVHIVELTGHGGAVGVVREHQRLLRQAVAARLHGQASHGERLAGADLVRVQPAAVHQAAPDRV